jgi:hypothetical protein
VLDDLKIDADPEIRDGINTQLLLVAQAYFDNGGAPIKDFRAWMRANAEPIAKAHAKVRENATRGLTKALKQDAEIPGPKGSEAVAPEPKRERLSSRDMDKLASQQMKNLRL